jgi:UDP-glucose 4-epimerase
MMLHQNYTVLEDSILVTGGAGFIGSHLVSSLLESHSEVIILDDLSTGSTENVPTDATLIKGSIADELVYDSLPTDIDTVFHLAAQSSGEASFDNPTDDFRSHVVGTFQLLQWCDTHSVDRFVYASSMSVYGNIEYLPVDETHPPDPKTYYAAGKLAAEAYVSLFDNLDMNTTILRLFSVYGPGQNLENMKQGMVSIYLTFLLNEDEILVKGPLDRFRDFVFIDDAVDAFTAVVDEPIAYGQVYNVATGHKTEVRELLDTMIRCSEHEDFPIKVTSGTPGDQHGIFGDASNIEEDVGWSASTSLEEGIGEMICAERN